MGGADADVRRGYGNLAQKTGTGAAAAVGTADSRGLLNSVKNQIGAHDAAGNAVLPAGVYDFDNRLTEWGNERYAYDASNKRVVRTSVAVDSDKHVTFWVGSYKMGEYRYGWNGGWNLTAVSEWGMIGGRVVKPSDRLGSDISGGRTYLPYGEELNPSPGGRYKFATYWRDETGLDYADQRYYSPGSGRFLSSDPYMASGGTAEPSSWNRYSYVGGDPVNFVDPEGLLRESPQIGVDPIFLEFFWRTSGSGNRQSQGEPKKKANEPLRVANFSTTSKEAVGVQNSLRWFAAAVELDSDCNRWLINNKEVIGILLGERPGSTQVWAGVANLSETTVNAIAGQGGTDLPVGTALLTVNLGGAYFNNNANTDNGRIRGATDEARAFIILHELAHLTGAAGFLDNDRAPERQTTNNNLVHEHCNGVLNRAAGR